MRIMNPCVACLLAALALAACSGGSGSSSGGGNVDFSPVAGIYNASTNTDAGLDENYLYIGSNGEVIAYNYLGDEANAGDNCYREAQAGDVNYPISGQTLYWVESAREFRAEAGNQTALWRINTANEITHVGLEGGVAAGEPFSVSIGGTTFVIGIEKLNNISHADITAAICS